MNKKFHHKEWKYKEFFENQKAYKGGFKIGQWSPLEKIFEINSMKKTRWGKEYLFTEQVTYESFENANLSLTLFF